MPLLLILGLLVSVQAQAYPEFIGFKYSSCLTCHVNGHGNGPLNDYGRALWSAEIAGRLFSGNRTDEQLGESSGFLGRKEMPWWFRPAIKARQLNLESSPGSELKSMRSILMQAEANGTFYLDKNQNKAIVVTFGYVPIPGRFATASDKPPTWISREHYFRWQMIENLWMYFGFLDKVYGIRHVNHTAYSRAKVGVAQNDQSHSIIAHYIKPTWEFTLDAFMGNMLQDAALRQKGFSMMWDYEFRTDWRVGLSVLQSANSYVKNTRFGVHSRSGLGHGSAILFEAGFINDTPTAVGVEASKGYYGWGEVVQRLARGYHLFVEGQAYKANMVSGKSDELKAGGGLIMWPMARTELRIEFLNKREFSVAEVQQDTWQMLYQLHISL